MYRMSSGWTRNKLVSLRKSSWSFRHPLKNLPTISYIIASFLWMGSLQVSPRYRVLAIFQRSPKQSRAFSLSNKLRFSNFHCFTFSSKSSKPNINWPDSSVVEYVLWVISTLVRGLGFNVSLIEEERIMIEWRLTCDNSPNSAPLRETILFDLLGDLRGYAFAISFDCLTILALSSVLLEFWGVIGL